VQFTYSRDEYSIGDRGGYHGVERTKEKEVVE
jgi:hypothetical protein